MSVGYCINDLDSASFSLFDEIVEKKNIFLLSFYFCPGTPSRYFALLMHSVFECSL